MHLKDQAFPEGSFRHRRQLVTMGPLTILGARSGCGAGGSGTGAKSADTLFVIARTATKSSAWTIFTVGPNLNAVTWPSI